MKGEKEKGKEKKNSQTLKEDAFYCMKSSTT